VRLKPQVADGRPAHEISDWVQRCKPFARQQRVQRPKARAVFNRSNQHAASCSACMSNIRHPHLPPLRPIPDLVARSGMSPSRRGDGRKRHPPPGRTPVRVYNFCLVHAFARLEWAVHKPKEHHRLAFLRRILQLLVRLAQHTFASVDGSATD
jgi:hypothetical protein